MRQGRRAFVGALAALAGAPACAQTGATFPARPIRIVPFGTAGGPIDALARAYAERLAAR